MNVKVHGFTTARHHLRLAQENYRRNNLACVELHLLDAIVSIPEGEELRIKLEKLWEEFSGLDLNKKHRVRSVGVLNDAMDLVGLGWI